VPVVPSCLLEPAWVEFSALIGGDCPQFDPGHPLGIAPAGANRHDSPLLAPPWRPPDASWTAFCPMSGPATWTAATTAP
jgi:hypothetical protein